MHNKNKTHCKNGHEFTPENTRLSPRSNGKVARECRICGRAKTKRYREIYPEKIRERYVLNYDKQKARKWWIFYQYGMSIERYEELLSIQNNKCKLCAVPFTETRSPHVDHDHECCAGNKTCGECVRALLCGPCNRGLGLFKDNLMILQKAIEYIQSYRS